ncbi:MAG: hypothetical protein HY287_15395 [Planctomycetes bacterium]|nr:hypothetical protein [Planctomycetota bacterium]MBI3835709.1 hypothetical protein [Planctomycetota bacterium]
MVESKIGHLKSDHRIDRCFLKRLTGDTISTVPAAGSNLRKLLRRLAAALIEWLELPTAFHPSTAPLSPENKSDFFRDDYSTAKFVPASTGSSNTSKAIAVKLDDREGV